jgi:hypothetical protein
VRSGCREPKEVRSVKGYGLDEIERLGLGGGDEKKVRRSVGSSHPGSKEPMSSQAGVGSGCGV